MGGAPASSPVAPGEFDVTSAVKLVGRTRHRARFQAFSCHSDSGNWPGDEAGGARFTTPCKFYNDYFDWSLTDNASIVIGEIEINVGLRYSKRDRLKLACEIIIIIETIALLFMKTNYYESLNGALASTVIS